MVEHQTNSIESSYQQYQLCHEESGDIFIRGALNARSSVLQTRTTIDGGQGDWFASQIHVTLM